MSDININLSAGDKKRLLTGGKYCPDDIVVEAEGGDTDAAFEAGKKAEYDAFWDVYQNNGNRTNYDHAFAATVAGGGWTNEIARPKYDLKPTSAYMMFRYSRITGSMEDWLKSNGITFDDSNNKNVSYMYYECNFTSIPLFTLPANANGGDTFAYSKNLQEIKRFIMPETASVSKAFFLGCTSLETLNIEGTIAKDNFSLYQSPKLSKSSIVSIINALSSTTSGLTLTLSTTAVNTAFETSAGVADGVTTAEWLALVATKSNWNIVLA